MDRDEHQQDQAGRDGAGPSDAGGSAPLPLEAAPVTETCPNCGSPMRGTDALVCLRCGFDLKSLRVLDTRAEAPVEEATDAAEEGAGGEPLVRPGAGGPILPLILGGAAVLTLLVGVLAAAPGLVARVEPGGGISWPARFEQLGRLPIEIGAWLLCGLGGLFVVAWIEQRPFGPVGLAAARAAAIVAVARMLSFIHLRTPILQFLAEAVGQCLVAFLLLMGLFRLSPRNAGTVLAVAISGCFLLYAVAHVVAWAM